jgi:hypothetical protein
VTRGKGVRPFGEHVGDLVQVYFAEITSVAHVEVIVGHGVILHQLT